MTRFCHCLLAVLAAAPATAAEPPTFASDVESVYVDVFVSDRRGPVLGLTAADFDLRDDGVRQAVELVALDSMPLPVLLVLDTSGSVSGEKLVALQAAGRALLERLDAGDSVGLVTFGHEIQLAVPPTTELARVRRALEAIRAGGATALYDALYSGLMLAPRGRSLLVLFTDGEDNLSWLSAPELKRVLEGGNVMVHAVGIVPGRATSVRFGPGDQQREPDEPSHVRVLRQLAEATGGRFWAAADPGRLRDAFAAVLDAMKTRYVLRFQPAAARRPGLHALEVRLTRSAGTVHSRKAYFVGPIGARP